MLVYSSALEIQGQASHTVLLHVVKEWVRQELNRDLDPQTELRTDGTYQAASRNRSELTIAATKSGTPELISWVITTNKPRERTTLELEVSGRLETDTAYITCNVSLASSAQSTRKKSFVRKPEFLDLLERFVRRTPTVRFSSKHLQDAAKRVSNPEDCSDIRDRVADLEREVPVILLSQKEGGGYSIDPAKLQSNVAGLALVYYLTPTDLLDQLKLANIVSPQLQPWDGTIHLIDTRRSGSPVLRVIDIESDQLEQLDDEAERIERVLSLVVERTIAKNTSNRISFQSVQSAAALRQLSTVRSTINEEHRPFVELADSYKADCERLTAELIATRRDLGALEQEIVSLKAENHALKAIGRRFEIRAADSSATFSPENAIDMIIQERKPTVSECLVLLKSVYPDRIVLLPSALDSAQDHIHFQETARFMNLLYKLGGEYYDILIEKGDSEARKVLGNGYAPTESDTTKGNPKAVRERTFHYNGQDITMFQHLKIGIKDSSIDSIRLYFEWDADTRKIVIGHCGRHLFLPKIK